MNTAKLVLNTPVKRNIYIAGRRTSLQLESYVWDCVDSILDYENLRLSMLCTELKIRSDRLRMALAIRLFTLIYFRTMSNAMNPYEEGADLVRSPPVARFNCLIEALQILSQRAPRA